jgi:DNA helicase IV
MSLPQARAARLKGLEQVLVDGKAGELFEAVLLDEAQDYSAREITAIRSLSKTIGATSDSKQKIYPVDDCSEVLEASVDVIRELHFHFRNGAQICRVADAIMDGKAGYVPMLQDTQYNEKEYPSTVTVRRGLTVQEQAAAILEQVKQQRAAYPEDVLGVLCPQLAELDEIWDVLSASEIGSDCTKCKSQDFDAERRIWFSTVASAKGLEFRAVHLAGTDQFVRMGPAQKRLAFTAVTRAKTALTIYLHKRVPGYLDKGLRLFEAGKGPISKAMIFGKG